MRKFNVPIEMGRFAIRWNRFLHRFDKRDDETPSILDVLVAQYSGPGRYYHGLWHINDGLDLLEEARRDRPEWFADPRIDAAIELAFFEHDVVYGAALEDNEKRSGELAQIHAGRLGFDVLTGASAHWYVTATTHKRMAPTREGQIVCDIDLAPLAAPWGRFCENTELVRKEYRHVRSDALFAEGRKKFFAAMLDPEIRPVIYQTDYFRERFESRARANMQRVVDTT
ncbi:MAG: hypothetical protein Q7S95_02260 [bacterium]|nr:hypothetical protein [bacterium]